MRRRRRADRHQMGWQSEQRLRQLEQETIGLVNPEFIGANSDTRNGNQLLRRSDPKLKQLHSKIM
jgi:hypothetical protein